MSGKKVCFIGGKHLVFMLHWSIHSAKRREPERTLGSHIKSPIRW
jgi:hypothetical protein